MKGVRTLFVLAKLFLRISRALQGYSRIPAQIQHQFSWSSPPLRLVRLPWAPLLFTLTSLQATGRGFRQSLWRSLRWAPPQFPLQCTLYVPLPPLSYQWARSCAIIHTFDVEPFPSRFELVAQPWVSPRPPFQVQEAHLPHQGSSPLKC